VDWCSGWDDKGISKGEYQKNNKTDFMKSKTGCNNPGKANDPIAGVELFNVPNYIIFLIMIHQTGLEKILRMNKTVFNIFAEPQFTVLAEGIGQPTFQTFVGVNTQF
jgi:hypothetical protein